MYVCIYISMHLSIYIDFAGFCAKSFIYPYKRFSE